MTETYSIADVQRMAQTPQAPELFTLDEVRSMARPRVSALDSAGRVIRNLTPAGIATNLLSEEGRNSLANLAAGALRGAGSIGATVLAPLDMMSDAKSGKGLSLASNRQRRADMDAALQELGADPASIAYQAGKLGAEVAGTQGVGQVVAAPIRALAGTSPVGQALANAVATSGMRTGVAGLGRGADLGIRTLGSAVSGGASAGLVDPSTAGTGAAIGAAVPATISTLGGAGKFVNSAIRSMRMPADVRTARDIAVMAGARQADPASVAGVRDALLVHGPEIIPGQRTVPEILQKAGVSQLQRSVAAVNPAPFVERAAEREAARRAVLEQIAPVGNAREVADEVGTAISEYARAGERAAARNVNQLFDSIPADQARIQLPLQRMQDAQTRFLGPGTFGKGGATVEQAMQTATNIGMDQRALMPRAVPFNEVQSLRSSIGEAITDAQKNGRNQAAAALTAMKNAIDDRVAEVASGMRQPGEDFTPEAIDAWGQALNAHAAKKARFDTGPQVALFRRAGDGLPAAQGGEVPRRFFNANASQVSDAQAFRRLVQDDPRLIGELRRYAVSDAAGQVDRMGNLTNDKFNKWLTARAGATGEIFSDQQRAWLKAIADDLRRADIAESLGRSTGSDTAQKAASMLGLGLVDGPGMRYIAGKVPFGLGSAALDFVGGPIRTAKAERLAGLLGDPERTAGLLGQYIAAQQPAQGLLGQAVSPALYRAGPVLLTH